MGIFSKFRKEERVVIFDVGSSSIGCAYVVYDKTSDKEKPPIILHAKRHMVPFQQTLEFERFLNQTVKTLEEAATELEKKYLGAPDRVVCLLGAPWYASKTRTITHSENGKPFTFSKRLAHQLIEKDTAIFEDEERKEFQELEEYDVAFVESKPVLVRLNGYPTTDPIGKKATEADIVMFLGIVPNNVTTSLKQAIKRFFHRPISFHTSLFSLFVTLRDIFPKEDTYLFIDVGGEVTEIAVVRHDIIEDTISFPFAKNTLIRALVEKTKKTPPEILSMVKMYAHGLLDPRTTADIAPIFAELQAKWIDQFQHALEYLSKKFLLPERIFVASNRNVAKWFVDGMKNEELFQYTFTHKKFDIVTIDPTILQGLATFVPSAERDPYLLIGALFGDKIIHKQIHE